MATTNTGLGQYKNTQITDFYLGNWVPPFINEAVTDRSIILTAKYNGRPDILSFDIYGTSSYWWVFMMRNKDKIFDPIGDFVPGLEILVPVIPGAGG